MLYEVITFELRFILGTFVEVVQWLKALVGGMPESPADLQGLGEPFRVVVRRSDRPSGDVV